MKFGRMPRQAQVLAAVVLQLLVGGKAGAETSPDQAAMYSLARSAPSGVAEAAGGKREPERRPGGQVLPRKVSVGLYQNKPKIYTDAVGGPAGIFPSILDEIARNEGWDVTWVPCEWFACLQALQSGRIDLMPDVAYSLKRDEQFDFHEEEVVASWSALYASGSRHLDKIADLDGRRVAVLKGSIQQTILEQMVRGFGFNVTFVEANSFEEAYALTAGGGADAVVSNHFYGDFFHQSYGLKKTPVVFNPVSLYFAVASGANRDLLLAIDEKLRELKADPNSVYYRALARWMEKPTVARVPPHVIWVISGISGLLVLAVAFILLLRWQVRVGTRKLASANEQLLESEKMFRDLFHRHAAVKLLIDPETGSIVEANEAAEKFYGWSREQLLRMRIQDINTLPAEKVGAEMQRAREMHSVHFEFRHRLADGSVRDVVVFSSGIDVNGRPLLHSIVHDISERRRLEEQLRQAQKMEAVGRLAGGVAHDYNNMLGVILGRTELALNRMSPADPAYAHLKEVLGAATRSAEITRQLLGFARKQTVAPRVVDLNEAVAEILKMLRWLIGENIDLAWLPAPGLWPVKLDTAQVDQILANLCVNARDAISGMGKITIETGNATFDRGYCAGHDGYLPGEYVLLAVSDNGCGMDREMLDHVFEPFFTTKGIGEGTGLGLATVYGIVKQNRGFINVYSEPANGTTFRLYFPRHEGAIEPEVAENAGEMPRGGGETLLLVEDDRAIREMSRVMLEGLGYRVLEAATPGDAVRLADEHPDGIDLLITDVIMPEMNGRDLADRLNASHPGLKTVFMSGYTANVIARQGVLDTGVHFLQKPFTQRDLAVKVREGLGSPGTTP